jgi:hypothetical protein
LLIVSNNPPARVLGAKNLRRHSRISTLRTKVETFGLQAHQNLMLLVSCVHARSERSRSATSRVFIRFASSFRSYFLKYRLDVLDEGGEFSCCACISPFLFMPREVAVS